MQDFIVFGIAAILIFIAPLVNKCTKLPSVVVEILLGALVLNEARIGEVGAFKDIAHIGFLFLMFLAGIEVEISSFFRLGRVFLKRVFLYFFTLYICACAMVLAFGLSIIYIAALPVMSIGMIIVLIQDYKKSTDKSPAWLDLALKIGIIGELISISMLVLLDGYYSFGLSIDLGASIGILAIFSAIVMLLFKCAGILFWCFPSLRNVLIPENCAMNEDIRYSMALFFIMILIVSLLKIEAALGAFISGVIISNFFKTQKDLHTKLNDIGFGFLIPLFFIYIGSTLDFGAIFSDRRIILHALDICVAMILVRFLAGFVAFKKELKSWRKVALFTFGSAMPLTFLVATATLGLNIGAIEKSDYFAFVLAAMLEAVVFMTIIKIIAGKKVRESLENSPKSTHESFILRESRESLHESLESHESPESTHESSRESRESHKARK